MPAPKTGVPLSQECSKISMEGLGLMGFSSGCEISWDVGFVHPESWLQLPFQHKDPGSGRFGSVVVHAKTSWMRARRVMQKASRNNMGTVTKEHV